MKASYSETDASRRTRLPLPTNLPWWALRPLIGAYCFHVGSSYTLTAPGICDEQGQREEALLITRSRTEAVHLMREGAVRAVAFEQVVTDPEFCKFLLETAPGRDVLIATPDDDAAFVRCARDVGRFLTSYNRARSMHHILLPPDREFTRGAIHAMGIAVEYDPDAKAPSYGVKCFDRFGSYFPELVITKPLLQSDFGEALTNVDYAVEWWAGGCPDELRPEAYRSSDFEQHVRQRFGFVPFPRQDWDWAREDSILQCFQGPDPHASIAAAYQAHLDHLNDELGLIGDQRIVAVYRNVH